MKELAGLRRQLEENPEGFPGEEIRTKHRQAVEACLREKLAAIGFKARALEERDRQAEQARQAAALLPSAGALDKLLRYETTVERQLYRAMHQLERLQRRRLGEVVPAPAVLEVTSGC